MNFPKIETRKNIKISGSMCAGVYFPGKNLILIKEDLKGFKRLGIITHELGHWLIDCGTSNNRDYVKVSLIYDLLDSLFFEDLLDFPGRLKYYLKSYGKVLKRKK